MLLPALRDAPMTPQSIAQAPIPQADIDRRENMKHAWKAYHGEFQDPLKVVSGQPNDNIKPNRCAPIVNKGISFLFGQVLKMQADDQDFLDGLWGDDDDRMTLLSKIAMNGGVCGQAFVKIVPAEGDMPYPRLVNLNPACVRIVTPEDDCELVLAYIIEYPSVTGIQKRQVIARIDPDNMAAIAGQYDLDDTWTTTNYVREDEERAWRQVGPVEAWPYPFAPILMCQNLPSPNESWGIPDLTPDLIDMNRVLNFVQSNTARIIKFHGHPRVYAVNMRAAQIEIGVDDILCLPSPDSKLEALAAMENFSGLLSFAANLRDDMDEQSRVPAVALGRLEALPKGNISGVALQLLFQPLIEKTIQKQRLYGKLIREVSRAALVVAGKIGIEQYEDYDVEINWQNLLPVDDLAAAQTALILKQIGVSDATILQQLGYDPDDEAEQSAEEDAKKLEQFSKGQGMPPALPPGQPPQAQPQQSPFIGGGNQQ